VWGFVPGFSLDHETVSLHTRDGVELVADHLAGPDGPDAGPAVLLLHGFGAHRRKPAYVRLAERLTDEVAVLAPDLRGHGASGGRSSLGDREVHDVRACAAWLRRRGHPWVAGVGASMGATALLRAAGSSPPGLFDAVCAISAPAEFITDGIPAVRALARMMSSTPWRLLVELGLRVRVAHAWGEPVPSLRLVERIAPTPLLVVHGHDDAWFAPDHADRLYGRAREPKVLWSEPPGFGHAEDGFTDAFVDRLGDAVRHVHEHGRWPDR
jgi:alpha-beta hydrolase superfamily lysophospholipase